MSSFLRVTTMSLPFIICHSQRIYRGEYIFIVFISLDAEVIPQCRIELFDKQLLNISDKNKEQNQDTLSNFMIVC